MHFCFSQASPLSYELVSTGWMAIQVYSEIAPCPLALDLVLNSPLHNGISKNRVQMFHLQITLDFQGTEPNGTMEGYHYISYAWNVCYLAPRELKVLCQAYVIAINITLSYNAFIDYKNTLQVFC